MKRNMKKVCSTVIVLIVFILSPHQVTFSPVTHFRFSRTVQNLTIQTIFANRLNFSHTLDKPMKISIRFFNDREIRAAWDDEHAKSWFSVVDVVGILNDEQDNPKDKWQKVPIQDFTKNSYIDWTKSITEIEQQLYQKYQLGEEEIAFIEKMIKPME